LGYNNINHTHKDQKDDTAYVTGKGERSTLFHNILLPISSEYYAKNVLKRGAFLAKIFHCPIHLVYIIEEKTLRQTDKLTDAYRTKYDIDETKKDIIRKKITTADHIIFSDAHQFFKSEKVSFTEKIVRGEFSSIVEDEVETDDYDLVLMGFEKECVLQYRLLDSLHIPIWIEMKSESSLILGICTNLAPNQQVPPMSIQLAQAFGWDLRMVYIIDTRDMVVIDEKGNRSERKSKHELDGIATAFSEMMRRRGILVDIIEGNFEKEVTKLAEQFHVGLVVIGREQRKKMTMVLSNKNFKRKIAEKCGHSLLFMN
jgi:K+-sensing histidine kinase KdpD